MSATLRRAWAVTLALVVAVLLLAGPPVDAQPREGDVTARLRFPFPQDDGSLTPYTFELGYPLVTLIYDTLMWRDARGVPRPWLARSVTTGPDGRRVTIRLRPGVRWHDGVPLTAQDVAFTFRFVAGHPHPRFSPQLAEVRRVEATDRLTVAISLARPSLGFPDQPLADLPILPRHRWATLPAGQLAPQGLPVGSGPYRLVEYARGKRYRLRANRGYFRGRPRVRTLSVPIIHDPEETIRALEDRRVDMIPVSLTPEHVERLREFSIRVVRGDSYLGTVLLLNLRQPPFDRPQVRRAIAQALDIERLAGAAGRAEPAARGYLHPSSPWSSDAISHRFDPEAARRTLDSFAVPDIVVLAPNNDPTGRDAGRQSVLDLERAGLRVRLRELPPAALARAIGVDGSTPRYQAAIWSTSPLASYDPNFLRAVFGSDPRRARLNYSGYRSASFDALAGRVAGASGRRERLRLVGEELRLLARDVPVVPLFFSEGAFAYRPAAYDGWVFVKGTGILDKRSFLPGQREAAGPRPSGEPVDVSGGSGLPIGVFGLIAVLGLAAIVGLAGWGLLGRRS
ncbi:MAG: ABC transporter substrate-binding protein [Actinomycetota bacterium]|nr:ABC transporter substrate-binding protein [Actinomycetota bacterium]